MMDIYMFFLKTVDTPAMLIFPGYSGKSRGLLILETYLFYLIIRVDSIVRRELLELVLSLLSVEC